jgi:hypothetical protein
MSLLKIALEEQEVIDPLTEIQNDESLIVSLEAALNRSLEFFQKLKMEQNQQSSLSMEAEHFGIKLNPVTVDHKLAMEETSIAIGAVIVAGIIAVIAVMRKIFKYFFGDSSSGSNISSTANTIVFELDNFKKCDDLGIDKAIKDTESKIASDKKGDFKKEVEEKYKKNVANLSAIEADIMTDGRFFRAFKNTLKNGVSDSNDFNVIGQMIAKGYDEIDEAMREATFNLSTESIKFLREVLKKHSTQLIEFQNKSKLYETIHHLEEVYREINNERNFAKAFKPETLDYRGFDRNFAMFMDSVSQLSVKETSANLSKVVEATERQIADEDKSADLLDKYFKLDFSSFDNNGHAEFKEWINAVKKHNLQIKNSLMITAHLMTGIEKVLSRCKIMHIDVQRSIIKYANGLEIGYATAWDPILKKPKS